MSDMQDALNAEIKRLIDECVKRNLRINALTEELAERTASNLRLREEKDGTYRERNRLVAALARVAITRQLVNNPAWRAGLGRHPESDATWDREWMTIVFIDTPVGQLSWHIHDSELPLFEGIPPYEGTWDGHTTEEKYARLEKLR